MAKNLQIQSKRWVLESMYREVIILENFNSWRTIHSACVQDTWSWMIILMKVCGVFCFVLQSLGVFLTHCVNREQVLSGMYLQTFIFKKILCFSEIAFASHPWPFRLCSGFAANMQQLQDRIRLSEQLQDLNGFSHAGLDLRAGSFVAVLLSVLNNKSKGGCTRQLSMQRVQKLHRAWRCLLG